MARYNITTKRNYSLDEVASALQKAVRRNDPKLAGYFAVELYESGMAEYCWRRLLVTSAEDCWGVITQEIEALYRSYKVVTKGKKTGGRIFIAKAVLLLCAARKCRDADHLTNFVYDKQMTVSDADIEQALDEAREDVMDIPDYALDCHTRRGRASGKTKSDFFADEHDALSPLQLGLFDTLVERSP